MIFIILSAKFSFFLLKGEVKIKVCLRSNIYAHKFFSLLTEVQIKGILRKEIGNQASFGGFHSAVFWVTNSCAVMFSMAVLRPFYVFSLGLSS